MPEVMITLLLPLVACEVLLNTLVDDSHSVPSKQVAPPRVMAVRETSPSPAPCTVTDADPVFALLTPCTTLKSPPKSIETAMLPVPDRSPTVITTRRVPPAP